jgi:hypothetical protein
MRTTPCTDKKGIALVLTLAILVIATILVVGFASSMRTERQAAASVANNTTAEIIAQTAVDHAISLLDKNIPQPVPPGGSTVNPVNWIINPGLLTTVAGALVQIPLSSNPSVAYTGSATDAELNPPLLAGGGNLILPTADSMRVAWIPVLKDQSSTAGPTNQMTARYAFWIDDENSKINLNTAYGKPSGMSFNQLTPGVIAVGAAAYPLGHPSSINLDVLNSSGNNIDPVGVAAAVGNEGGFSSIDSVKAHLSAGNPTAFFNANKFYLTAYSRDQEFNVFGKPRLYFMRKATGQLGFPLVQFFRDKDGPNYFPSEENGTGADKYATYYGAAAISAYLNRNDWPGMPAHSFIDKWGGGTIGQREADQVAWNLMSLGSFAAGDFTGFTPSTVSSQYFQLANATASGQVGFVSVNKPNKDAVIGALSNKALIPAFPMPLVNEVSLVISPESYTIADGTQKYRLNVSLNTELWLPPGYPAYDFAQAQTTVGLTSLSYLVTQAPPGTANASQTDAKYVDLSAAPNDNGIRKLWMSNNGGTMTSGQYTQLTTALPFYVSNKTGFNSGASGSEDFTTAGMISLNFKMRLFAISQQKTGPTYGTKHTYQLIPVWDKHDPGTAAAPTTWDPSPPANPPACITPPTDDPKDYIEFQFDLDPSSFSSGEIITRSLEVADPRLGGLAKTWKPSSKFADPTAQSIDTMGGINNATTTAGYDTKKLAFPDLSSPGPASNRPSTGVLSFLATGMQRGLAGASLKFQPSATRTDLPDWILLDLVAPNVVAANFSKMSYMNSTAGKVNVNGAIYPANGSFTVPQRWQPLQGLFENMPGTPSGASSASTVVSNILTHNVSGLDYGAPGVYDYPGEICEIAGVADSGASDWDKEVLIRNLASAITTKSNVFSVWGVAQTVKKNLANNNPGNQGIFETKAGGAAADDIITGEKRFEAVVERYVWPGSDAAPGNAHAPPGGSYDRVSSSQSQPGYAPPYSGGTWEPVDGPNAPTYPITTTDPWTQNGPNYSSSTIDAAINPAGAVTKYRVIYFRYLND